MSAGRVMDFLLLGRAARAAGNYLVNRNWPAAVLPMPVTMKGMVV